MGWFDNITNAFNKAKDWVSDTVSNIGNKVNGFVTDVGNKGSHAVTQVYGDITGGIKTLYTDAKDAIVGAKDFAKSNVDSVFGVVKGAEDSISNIAWPLVRIFNFFNKLGNWSWNSWRCFTFKKITNKFLFFQ
jgi:hypothetical protein